MGTLKEKKRTRGFRLVPDFFQQEKNEQREHPRVDQREKNQRKPKLPGGDVRRKRVSRLQKILDDPRLAPDLRRDPARLIRQLREQERGNAQREPPARGEQAPAKPQQHSRSREREHHDAAVDHPVEALERQLQRRTVLGGNVVEPEQTRFRRHFQPFAEHDADDAGNGDSAHGSRFFVDPADDVKARRLAAVENAFHRREFHGLNLFDQHRARVSGSELQHDRRGGNRQRGFQPAFGDGNAALFQQVPRADGKHEKRSREPRRREHVPKAVKRRGIEDHRPEIRDFRAQAVFRLDEREARRRLHPRVRHEYPKRAQMRAQAHHDDGKIMEAFRDFFASEKDDAQKARFHEKRENRFRGERAPEHVADEARIPRPVRAELEFEHDARGDAEREDQRENFRPKIRQRAPDRVFRLQGETLRDDEEDAQTYRQRREQEVKSGGQRELDAGKQFGIHNGTILKRAFPPSKKILRRRKPSRTKYDLRGSQESV